MDQFRKSNMLLGIVALFVCISLVSAQADDFPGPYCRTRPGGCCKGRKDACAVPISSECFKNNSTILQTNDQYEFSTKKSIQNSLESSHTLLL